MVQEVQTSVGATTETTLETIEAIGTSSFKIIEGRQTTARFTRGCVATGNVEHYFTGAGSSGEKKSNDTTITSQIGKEGFSMLNGGVRVPMAGTYQMTVDWGGGGSSYDSTIIIKGGGRTLYTKTFSGSYQTESATFSASLGKFETVEIRGEFTYHGSGVITIRFNKQPVLTITQL